MTDPADPIEMHEVGPHVTGPGRGVGGGRKPGPGPRNKPRNPNGPRVAAHVTFDPDVHRHVAAYATANGIPFSEAVNVLLAAAVKEIAA